MWPGEDSITWKKGDTIQMCLLFSGGADEFPTQHGTAVTLSS